MISVCSPIPGGLLTPAFILGAVFGRLYGYILRSIGIAIGINLVKCKSWFYNINTLDEGIYAIVGAASLAGSVTRTVSLAMMVFEMCG